MPGLRQAPLDVVTVVAQLVLALKLATTGIGARLDKKFAGIGQVVALGVLLEVPSLKVLLLALVNLDGECE